MVFVCSGAVASASPIVIGFDSLADLAPVTTQFTGLTFSNATALKAGMSLNEFEFPPHSAADVVFDSGGPISIDFDAPVLGVGAFFTYLVPVTLEAFDDGHNSLGIVSSSFFSNLQLSGDAGSSPNEFLEITSSAGIRSILITGDPAGGSFTLDDLTVTPVPEPATFALVLAGAAAVIRKRRTGRDKRLPDDQSRLRRS